MTSTREAADARQCRPPAARCRPSGLGVGIDARTGRDALSGPAGGDLGSTFGVLVEPWAGRHRGAGWWSGWTPTGRRPLATGRWLMRTPTPSPGCDVCAGRWHCPRPGCAAIRLKL